MSHHVAPWRRRVVLGTVLPALLLFLAGCGEGKVREAPRLGSDAAKTSERAPGANSPALPPEKKADPKAPPPEALTPSPAAPNTENYQPLVENTYRAAAAEPLSTFSISVDTASYSNVRRFLNQGDLPPKDAVRIAELVNYFEYDYATPKGDDPVGMALELGPCPWDPKHRLARIALKGRVYDSESKPARNLVFLVDVSGSMGDRTPAGVTKLELVKQSLRLLLPTLTHRDRVSVVTYAASVDLLLPPVSGEDKMRIGSVIDGLVPGGGTRGGEALKLAYDQAQINWIEGGLNRIVLMTDGDFNLGPSSDAEMVRLVEDRRKTGVYLTIVGFGIGNLKDSKLEQIARHGNGHFAYVDSLAEAHKVFVEQGGSLSIVAKDVKLQVEFNPAKVGAYRLIGYENRLLQNQDFNDDAKDAGDMGSGHTVTALYEVVPAGVPLEVPGVDPLKYQVKTDGTNTGSNDWLTVKLRYKHPADAASKLMSVALPGDVDAKGTSADFRFAAAVAAFGMILRDSPYRGSATLDTVLTEAQASRGADTNGYRAGFVELVRKAKEIVERGR